MTREPNRPAPPGRDADLPGEPRTGGRPAALLARLDAIASVLADRPDALGLLALGSVGRERERLDAYSDLDFFVLVEPDAKPRYLADLDWLATAHPIAFAFRNTVDGYKALFADGIFAEMAVFAPAELAAIPYGPGRFVWRRETLDPALAEPLRRAHPDPADPEWLLGELLTNLLVGLQRFRRGERLAAARLVQVHAVDRLLELLELRAVDDAAAFAAPAPHRDPFARERRIERRLPWLAPLLSGVMPGYEQTPAAAGRILDLVAARWPIAPALRAAIEALLDAPGGDDAPLGATPVPASPPHPPDPETPTR